MGRTVQVVVALGARALIGCESSDSDMPLIEPSCPGAVSAESDPEATYIPAACDSPIVKGASTCLAIEANLRLGTEVLAVDRACVGYLDFVDEDGFYVSGWTMKFISERCDVGVVVSVLDSSKLGPGPYTTHTATPLCDEGSKRNLGVLLESADVCVRVDAELKAKRTSTYERGGTNGPTGYPGHPLSGQLTAVVQIDDVETELTLSFELAPSVPTFGVDGYVPDLCDRGAG